MSNVLKTIATAFRKFLTFEPRFTEAWLSEPYGVYQASATFISRVPKMIPGIYTRSYDPQRTGTTLNETLLTPASVTAKGLVSYYSFLFEGDARGTEAPTLILPGVMTDDNEQHDIAFSVTMANDVYGHDANTGTLLWQRRIANPIIGTRAMDMYLINDHWGIVGCPVIDPVTQIGYCVAMTSPDGSFAKSSHWLHSIDLVDGSEAYPPLDLSLATYQPPQGLRLMVMGAVARKQRCGLLLDQRNGHKTVFVCNGSFLESEDTNQGWVIACDVTTIPKIQTAWTSTSRYSGGGIWMGSQGPSLDPATGDLLLTVGNGAFDGLTDFGESCVRLHYTLGPPATLTVVQHATPFTDTGRVAGLNYQMLADTSLLPANYQDDDDGASNMDSSSDEDLNSGGPLLILASRSGLSKDIVAFAGKDGILYLVDAANMGNQQLADFAPTSIQAKVYAKFLAITGFTYYPGTTPITPTDLSRLPTTYGGFTHHLHSTPVFYLSSVHGPMLFCMGENSALRAWRINADFSVTFLAAGVETASPLTPAPGGMPGGMLTLSANGTQAQSAIIWACVPMGNANNSITPGRLLAYDAETFNTHANGSQQLTVLWDSLRWNIAFPHNKFCIPHVWNGKIFLPRYDDRVDVYQLA